MTIFQDGGNKPEVVFHDGSQCGGRCFSTDYDCLMVAQLTFAIGQTRDRSGRTSGLLPPPWKTLWIDLPYVYQLEFIKNHVPHTGNRSESALPVVTLANRRKWLGLFQPTFISAIPYENAILEQRLFIHHGYNHNFILFPVYPMSATILKQMSTMGIAILDHRIYMHLGRGHLASMNIYPVPVVWSNIRFR